MKRLKIFIKISAVIIVIYGVFMGYVAGFPWERIIARYKARNYVEQTYGLTITRTRISMLLDEGITATVSTKENPFDFKVYMSRSDLNNISDDYLDCKTEYVLGRDLNNYVEKVTDKRGSVNISVISAIINEFSLAELETNPKIAFEKLKYKYDCDIDFNDNIAEENYQFDFNEIYDIYKRVFECELEPTRVIFTYSYDNVDESYLRIQIDKEDFQYIQTSEDLKPYFEEAIKQKIK